MYPEEEKIHGIEMKVNLLEKDIQQTDRLCQKLSESIEKLQEVNTSILRMITIHEQRHEQHEKVEEELKEDIKEIHSRITTVNRELLNKIDEVEKTIGDKIDNLHRELVRHEQRDKTKLPEILNEIDKYKWMILGGAIALGWVIGHVNLEFLGKLLK